MGVAQLLLLKCFSRKGTNRSDGALDFGVEKVQNKYGYKASGRTLVFGFEVTVHLLEYLFLHLHNSRVCDVTHSGSLIKILPY